MNIVFITHYSQLYGANRSLLNLIEGLEQVGGYKCYLIAPFDGQIVRLFQSKGYETFVHPFETISVYKTTNLTFADIFIKNFNALQTIINKIINWKIDLIYTNTSILDIGLLASKILKIPHIYHIREFGDLDYDIYPIFGPIMHKILFCMSDGLIFISEAVKSHLFGLCSHSNEKVIYNGVVSEDFLKKLKDNKKISTYKIDKFAIVGLLHQKKGQITAIRAFRNVVRHFQDAKLLVAGHGQILPILKMMVLQTALQDNVYFVGEIYEPIGFFMNVDVGLMCSQHEAMGRVTVEAFAGMCPVIATYSGANPEIVDHGNNGYLYMNVKELSEYMIATIENPQNTRQMGINGYNKVADYFTIEKYTAGVIEVINNAISQNNKERYIEMTEVDYRQLINEDFWKAYSSIMDLSKVISLKSFRR